MNSRMNVGGRFSIPQAKENQIAGSWTPVTSEKPVHSRTHFIPVERYGNQLGGGFSIPQNQYTDSRILVTSENPVPSRSHMIPVERYGNQFEGGFSIPENQSTGSRIPITSEKPVLSRSHLIPVEPYGNQFGGVFSIPQNQSTGSRIPVPSEKPIPPRSHMIPVERYGSQFGGGFSIPENQIAGSWIPVTPAKPIPTRPHLIPAERYGNRLERADWQELGGFPNGHIQEPVQYFNSMGQVGQSGEFYGGEFYGGNVELTDRNQMINHIAGSYAQQLNNDREGWNTNLLARKNAASRSAANRTPNAVNKSLTPNLHSQVDGTWSTTGSGSSLLANQGHYWGSNLPSIGDSLPQIPQNGFPIPYQPSFNLNSPPRAEANTSSSVTNSFQLAPVTPDPTKKLENNQLSAILNLSTDEIICQEKDKQKNLATPIGNEVNQYHCDELLQNIVDSSAAAIYTTVTEKKDSDRGGQGIDLNKTPEQKPPKRRKHRPKVIVEGKPKRPPKPATNRSSDSKENPSGKRKYVRRKGMKESAGQLADVMKETTNPNAETSTKSCKRALNFDLETTGDESRGKENDQQNMKRRIEQPFNLNLDYQVTELCIGTESVHERNSATEIGLQNGFRLENQQLASTNNLIHYSNQMPTGYISVPERLVAAAQVATMKDQQIINLNVIAKNIDVGNVEASQTCSKNRYTTLVQHNHAEGIKQNVFQAKKSHVNLERTRQLMSQSTPQSVPKILPNYNEARGSKKGYRHTIGQTHACTVNPGGSSLLRQEILHVDECYRNGSSLGSGFSENHKKMKIDDGLSNTCSLPRLKAVEDGPIQAKRKGAVDVKANDCTSEMNHEILNCYFERTNTSKRLNNEVGKFAGDWCNHSMAAACDLLKQHVSSEPHSCSERQGETDIITQIRNFVSQTTVENCNLLPPSTPKYIPAPGNRKVVKSCHTNISAKKHTVRPNLSKSISIGTDKVLQEHDTLYDYQTFAGKTRGPPGTQKYPIPFFDEVINRMKALNINGKSNNIEGHEQMAIVPVKNDGTVVLHEGVTKKRKPRPKVDLDPETDRIWKLLMGKEASEDDEVTDKEKEKWWEEERIVFQGRADSFIARMHLVQGDRRFSRWKGSVVDSVIGVFLTQNVSDHLSSSAFMSLAARFPIRSTTNNKACDKNATTILIEESEVCILNPEEAIEWHETISGQLICNQQSTSPQASREHQGGSGTQYTERTSLEEVNCQRMEEEVISSQDSYDPTVDQGNGGIRYYSGSNSEAEDPTPWRKPNEIHGSTSTNLLHLERTSMFQEFYSLLNGSSLFDDRCKHGHMQLEDIEHCWQDPRPDGADNLKCSSTFNFLNDINNSQMQVPAVPSRNYQLKNTPASGLLEVEGYKVFGEESISSWPFTASGITKEKDASCMSNRIGQQAESVGKTVPQQNGVPRSKETVRLDPYALFTLHHESTSQPEHRAKYNQGSYYNHPHERNKSFSLESMSVTEPVKYAEAPAEMQNSSLQHIPNAPKVTEKTFDVEERICAANKEICLGNKLVKPKSKQHVDSSGKEYSEKKTNVSKAKRGKAEGEKKNAVDWDSLRKQVLTNGGIKERSKDTADSLDYEAMRCAKVNEISEAIKERGMNNMLAERMKEFLNRLVRDHGNTDLEWLRNVSPEKAKDYLLSIRGLGLKSVECVRLLTLHHLAFPVDTNVGRIAVRLGWVPLQPLPESLQIHLLELYPMLESIQKYLWPRLCKLDQRTLYELHYQMITFGKVFCTKNKPNCNACPMRGECKHFASAFASARLALPGPEERSVVSSTIPISANRNSAVVINPALVPLLANGSVKETGPKFDQCEPIIEEPATPEQEIVEITESDIEDAFYEDPDEIPTIKLSPEEFTANLQSYMQENMELQDIDMSKALVALSREAASIPTPKLKNVNQLRTEHLVYELPDTHPLLKGMDRREPDDPSPYLLAIWTPGETANSIQLPERRCVAQKAGKLCSDKTCSSCNSIREANLQIVRGTILIPCRTAMRGSFPLNGTYFQVNEVFADHDSSLSPIEVPRAWIWNLPRRTVYFGTSVSTIFKGLSTEGIQYCFWRGFVCVRGFDRTSRAPRPLIARLHFPASKLAKKKNENR